MKKRLRDRILKSSRNIILFKPNDVRLSFYIAPLGDMSSKTEFSMQDLDNITLLNAQYNINQDLFDSPRRGEDGNIYALMEEGVLSSGQKTGADLGIYDYEPIINKFELDYSKYLGDQFVHSIDDLDVEEQTYFDTEDDYNFSNCILAEGNPLGGESTQVVITFKGYLEVTKSEFSIIRRCDGEKGVSEVYIPQDYIKKYQLRNGDELVGTCNESYGKMLITSLFTINQQSRHKWEVERKWFRDLESLTRTKNLRGKGDYTKTIIHKFGLLDGDSVFMYLNKNTQKNQILTQFIEELSAMFDKVIYINPQYKTSTILSEGYNITKFCTSFSDTFNTQATIALLGANYARRLIELGKRVAIVIDDIDAIIALDKQFLPEMPISKTILGSTKAGVEGSGTSFTLISLRNHNANSYNLQDIFKSFETLGIVIENNEIDLFNSYRV